jgi:hypothetical protein
LCIPEFLSVIQLFADLIKQYRTDQMGITLQMLHDFHEYDCERNHDLIVDKYWEIYTIEIVNSSFNKWKDSLHLQKRMASQFF